MILTATTPTSSASATRPRNRWPRKVRIGNERLSGSEALVLATDGLSERGIGVDEPEEAVEHAVQAAALEPEAGRAEMLARKVVETALSSHQKRRSGDNIAAAVAWLAGLRVR